MELSGLFYVASLINVIHVSANPGAATMGPGSQDVLPRIWQCDNFVVDEDMDYDEVATNDYNNDFVAANGRGCLMQMVVLMLVLMLMLLLVQNTNWKKRRGLGIGILSISFK